MLQLPEAPLGRRESTKQHPQTSLLGKCVRKTLGELGPLPEDLFSAQLVYP